jgi:hypothetical protein
VEIFAEGTVSTTTKWDVHHAGLARYRQGVVGGSSWNSECMRASGAPHPPPPARNGAAPCKGEQQQREGRGSRCPFRPDRQTQRALFYPLARPQEPLSRPRFIEGAWPASPDSVRLFFLRLEPVFLAIIWIAGYRRSPGWIGFAGRVTATRHRWAAHTNMD